MGLAGSLVKDWTAGAGLGSDLGPRRRRGQDEGTGGTEAGMGPHSVHGGTVKGVAVVGLGWDPDQMGGSAVGTPGCCVEGGAGREGS